jgi:nitroreductase
MPIDKPAVLDHPIHDLLRRRWSPRAFIADPVSPAALRSLLEAARWSASSGNSQPWHFLVARREEGAAFGAMLECLDPGNQAWAKQSAVLILTVAQTTDQKGHARRHAWYDLGQAVANLVMQASALGLYAHQMAGIEPERIREIYAVPQGYEPASAVALGYVGRAADLTEPNRSRETAPRSRRAQTEFVFAGRFGQPAKF